MVLDTTHLRLLPYSPWHWLALFDGIRPFEEAFGLPAAEGLRDFGEAGEVSPALLAPLRTATGADVWVHGFAIVPREHTAVIGSAGFKGPADEEGIVEIGYGIVSKYQGRGYATEAAAALVMFAFGSDGVRLVRAHTKAAANASTRV